ncbi:MAG: hypothetical protein KIT22_01590 [Verrucomicrobiae bacterium]|nr:hypothetical protein [Verrucomicrobiae bacterium]
MLDYLPRLIGAGVLVFVAWVLATVLKKIIGGVLKALKLDGKLGAAARDDASPPLPERHLCRGRLLAGVLLFLR